MDISCPVTITALSDSRYTGTSTQTWRLTGCQARTLRTAPRRAQQRLSRSRHSQPSAVSRHYAAYGATGRNGRSFRSDSSTTATIRDPSQHPTSQLQANTYRPGRAGPGSDIPAPDPTLTKQLPCSMHASGPARSVMTVCLNESRSDCDTTAYCSRINLSISQSCR